MCTPPGGSIYDHRWFSVDSAEQRVVPGRCPNIGSPCNCPGFCQPTFVPASDTRSDDEIRATRRQGWSSGEWVTAYKNAVETEDHLVRGEN